MHNRGQSWDETDVRAEIIKIFEEEPMGSSLLFKFKRDDSVFADPFYVAGVRRVSRLHLVD